MRLTQKLLAYLNRVFDKDAHAFLALRLRYDGSSMAWSVKDGVLSTTVAGGSGAALSIDLSAHTVATLAAHLAGRPGYSVPYADASSLAQLSARVLIDGAGDQDTSNGDHLTGYTSVLWAFLEPMAAELDRAATQIKEMVEQMSLDTADGEWMDEIGSYYGVRRQTGEADRIYGPRIIAEVIRPKANNIAISEAIDKFLDGVTSAITDAPLDVTSNSYGLFDAELDVSLEAMDGYGYGLIISSAIDLIEQLRDAGTHLRAVRTRLTQTGNVYFGAVALLGDTLTVNPGP